MKKKWVFLCATLAFLAVLYYVVQLTKNTSPDVGSSGVTSFEGCVAAGNPILESYLAQCIHEGKTYVQQLPDTEALNRIIEAIRGGDWNTVASLTTFSEFRCTKRDGMGGPPKCNADEVEGTPVSALPVIAQEGFHLREGTFDPATIIKDSMYYGTYKTTEDVYSDSDFPRGVYAIVFTQKDTPVVVYSIIHVSDGKIVRIDQRLDEINLTGFEPIEVSVTATSADNAPPGSIHNLPVPVAVAAVKSYVAEREGVGEGYVIILTAYEKDWSDSCLGLGGPAESCLFAITPGYEVTVQVEGSELRFRTNWDGSVIRQQF